MPQHGGGSDREMGLKSRICRRFKPTTTQTDPTKQPAENKLDRNFTAKAPIASG